MGYSGMVVFLRWKAEEDVSTIYEGL